MGLVAVHGPRRLASASGWGRKNAYRKTQCLPRLRKHHRISLNNQMTKNWIIDWQRNSLLVARGHGQGVQARLESLALQPWGPQADGRTISASEALRAAAQQAHAKGEVTLLIARDWVELRTLQIPRIDADELPDVIRLQAQRQFTSLNDAWIVDFVLLPRLPEQELQTALVAALPPAQLSELETACTSAGFQISHIALRPLEVARLATQSGLLSAEGCSMVVSLSDSVADLLVLRAGHVVQVRSTKLPSESDLVAQALQGEVRRSLLAAAAEMGGGSVDSVLLIAEATVAARDSAPLAEAARAPVTSFQPERLVADHDAAMAGASAARLVGMAGSLGWNRADPLTIIDFKHPKRRPPKQRNVRGWILSAAAAAAVVLLVVGWYVNKVTRLNAEYAGFRADIAAKQEVGQAALAKLQEFRAIEEFLAASPNWLDELVYIAQQMPPASQVMLENPQFAIDRAGNGVITVTVKADSSASITAFEESLRSPHHIVSDLGANQLTAAEGIYRWRGRPSILVVDRGWSLGESRITPARYDEPQALTIDLPVEADQTQAAVDEAADELPTDVGGEPESGGGVTRTHDHPDEDDRPLLEPSADDLDVAATPGQEE